MSPELETIFAPLAAAIKAQSPDTCYLLDLLGGYAGENPEITRALALHGRDFLQEAAEENQNYEDLIAEMYRRTFFDPAMSAKYGTDEILQTPERKEQFARAIAGLLNMDTLASTRTGTNAHHAATTTKQ